MDTQEAYGEKSTIKNKATESKNNIQYSPVLFLVVSIFNNFGKYKAELFICCILEIQCSIFSLKWYLAAS